MEKVIEIKSCKQCNLKFEITDKDLEFYKKISPKFNGKTYKIPIPTLCPDCRQQRRFSFRNERNLYKGKSDLNGESMISMFSPDNKCLAYTQKQWWGDDWDCLEFGIDYDSEKSFFKQFGKLIKTVPHLGMSLQNGENSDFSNFSQDIKNCYLSTRVAESEDIYYCYLGFNKSDNCFDCFNVNNCHQCYELIDSKDCFNTHKSIYCNNCRNLLFCNNCQDCNNCFGCSNLISKEFYFYNEKLSKEEYFKKLQQENLQNYSSFLKNIKKSQKHFLSFPVKALNNTNCENCLGNNLTNSNDITYAFDCNDINGGKFLNGAIYGENQYDTDFNYYGENTFELISCGKSNTVLYSFSVHNSHNIFYCYNIKNSSNLFGCVNVKDKEYCILNKQYTKEEYNKLVPKIIEHMRPEGSALGVQKPHPNPLLQGDEKDTIEWGEFFPGSISPFGYNETVASEYFPLAREEILKKGFKWSDYKAPFPKVEKIIPAEKLPENIKNIPDDILNRAIKCEVSKKPFKIIKQELDFYRKHNLPIPRKHPNERHLDRIKLRNPRKLFDRKCDKCKIDMKTTYSPDREEIVYCEECYNKKVY